jgi:hypothetical protein
MQRKHESQLCAGLNFGGPKAQSKIHQILSYMTQVQIWIVTCLGPSQNPSNFVLHDTGANLDRYVL